MTNSNDTDVILDLGADRPDGVLQREVMTRLLRLLTEQLDDTKRHESPAQDCWKKNRTPDGLRMDAHHKHRAILLAGRRGEGKTTLLTDLLRQLEEGSFRDFDSADAEKAAKLLSLGLIDPTMLESKQNIILSVISRINNSVDHRHQVGDCSSTAADRCYRDVKEAFAELAKGVTVLDGVGIDLHKGDDWADPRYIMEHGLSQTEAAYSFRQRLDAYICKAATYLGCPGFVLCIDDVDTRFDMGQKVLEALRKYLTSPKLHVIVSGDPELMLTLVRRLQWQEMGKDYIDFEQKVHPRGARASQLDSALEHMGSLTDQYLTKVLPIDRRVRLLTLDELDRATTGGMTIRFAKGEQQQLREFLAEIVNIVWGVRTPEDLDRLSSVLLHLPIRSILEVLRAHAGERGGGRDAAQQAPQSNFTPRQTLEALLQISQTDLRNADAPALEALISGSADATFALISGWLSKHDMWQTHGELSTRFADDRENRVAFSLAALLAQRCRGDLGATLSFCLSFALLQDRVEREEAEIKNDSAKSNATDVLHLYEFLGMGRLAPPTVQMGRLAAWDRGLTFKRQVTRGLRLSGFAVPTSRIRNPNEAFKTLFGEHWCYSGSPASGSGSSPGTQGSNVLVFFENGNRASGLDARIESFPEEIRAYHQRLKGAQEGGYRYGNTRSYLKRAVYNTIEDLADRLDGSAAAVVRLPYSIVLSGQGASNGNYGFRRLLAVLIEVLNAARDKEEEAATKSVREVIEQAMIPRSHPTPSAKDIGIAKDADAGTDKTEDGDEDEPDDDVSEASPDVAETGGKVLAEALTKWAVRHRAPLEGKTIAPKVLLAVWKRFNYAQERLFEDPSYKKQNRRYLGYMMHRSVVMFLHAFAVETMRSENQPLKSRMQNNPIHDDKLFLELLDAMAPGFAETPGGSLFHALLDCPLWGFFLKEDPPQSELETKLGTRTRRKTKNGSATNVRSYYIQYLAKATLPVEPLFKARFTPAGKDVTPVEFDGLYDLLNSVYLQK